MAYGLNAKFTGPAMGVPRSVHSGGHGTGSFRLGAEIKDEHGRTFRYIKASEAITAGDILTGTAAAAWDTTIVTDGALTTSSGNVMHVDTITTAVAADYYKGGIVYQATAASKGYGYRIRNHEAFSASGEADVYLETDIAEAIADGASLYFYHPYWMELTDAATEVINAVAVEDIASGSYGFVQTSGVCDSVKAGHSTSAAIVLNEPLVPVAANPGAVQGFAAAGPTEAQILTGLCTNLYALEAVNANTTGFVRAFIKGAY